MRKKETVTNEMPYEMQLLQKWIHKTTGLEFAGWNNGSFALQKTQPIRYLKWLEEQKTMTTTGRKRGKIRAFDSGATRDTDEGKYDYEGFLSPIVMERYAQYMNKHRVQSNGDLRDSDNWQKGIPKDAYMKSGWRHFFDWWKEHRGIPTKDGIVEALCALLFNVMGYLHEYLKGKEEGKK